MNDDLPAHDRWAHLRFAIVGPLLAAPPRHGELKQELEALAKKKWKHPVNGESVQFAFSTLERWLRLARNEMRDPVKSLRKKVRRDAGTRRRLTAEQRRVLREQHAQHPSWSYQLHADNLAALIERDPSLGPMPSYSTVRRYMKSTGLRRRRRLGPRDRPGVERAQQRLETREVRSFEAEYVHSLWHLDYHHGSRKVLTAGGQWKTPMCLCVLDDCARLVCHAQWYLAETAENLIHALGQAILKRGLPRALMSDNGAAMLAAETTQGLGRLGIVHETTLPHSPYQNAKQEVFWAQLEGRLVAMLDGVRDLSLAVLNEATLAWVEREYHREVHREIGVAPLQRFLDGKTVGRPSPTPAELRGAFTQEAQRIQRRSDGTITVEGVRFELPGRMRHVERVTVRYASWDLSHVLLCDERTGAVVERLWPVDKAKNADGHRRALEPIVPEVPMEPAPAGMAPLLDKLITDYRADGVPPAYLPKNEETKNE